MAKLAIRRRVHRPGRRQGDPLVRNSEVLITNGPAAIANAIFDATGKRIRQVPFTPGRVRRLLRED
jgi:nicotinate dehydrogenase subunit B